MLNMKKLLTKILKCDFVVEEGTSGDWVYRKWNSGVVEAWGYKNFGSVTGTMWSSPVRYSDQNLALPSGLFVSYAPYTIGVSNGSQWWVVSCSTTTTNIAIRFGTVSSSAQAITASFYARGVWK